jgi:hypothetical protein
MSKPKQRADLPPHSVENEAGVIGCILLDPTTLADVKARFGRDTFNVFYDLRHQEIYKAILAGATDIITLQQKLRDEKLLDSCGGISYIAKLPDLVPSASNLPLYLDVVCEKFEIRRIIERCSDVISRAKTWSGDIEDLRWATRSDLSEFFIAGERNKLPDIEDANDFIAFDLDEPPQVIQGILHKGCKLALGGGSKTFKTWCFLDLALSVSHGLPWLGFETQKLKTIYVNLELPSWHLQRRLNSIARKREITIDPGQIGIWNLRGFAASYVELIPKLAAKLIESHAGLVILDPIYKLYGDADENSVTAVTALLNSLERLAQKTGAAIAFAAHFSKGNQAGKEAIDRISGSGAFARDPDAILTFTRHEEKNAFTVDSTLRNCKPVDPFVVRWNAPLMTRDDELDPSKLKETKPTRGVKYKATMLSDLLTCPMTASDWQEKVSEETGMARAKFYDLKKLLEDLKSVKRDPFGKWVKC